MVAMEHKRKPSWDSKISVSTVSTRRFSRAGTPSSILSSDSDIRFTRKLGSQYRCGCCVLAAFLLFLLFAGVSIYLGYTFLQSELPNDQIFLATFRVTQGDAFNPELADPSTDAFRQRSRSYRDRINLAFRRSPLQMSFVAAEILALDGVEGQDLMVHFDLRFDARYGIIDTESILSVLTRELTPGASRFFANLTIDPGSLEVQESASATSNLALATNASVPEEVVPTTIAPRPPRRCSPIEFTYCKHLPYNLTSYPNLLGHANLQEVNDDIIAFRELVDAECYKQAYDFICQALQPACLNLAGDDEDALSPPCRGFCKEFWAGCGSRLSERLRAILDCSKFPEYADLGSCKSKPGCIRELQTKALSSRICDGVIDCPDFSDERDCAYCREGHVHCGIGTTCIPRSSRCDGKIDCPNASDEKDCLSLAPSLKFLKLQPSDSAHPSRYTDEGYVVFNEKGTVGKICTDNLNNTLPDTEMQSVLQSTAQSLCSLMTFEGVKSVEVRTDEEDGVPYVLMQDPTAAEITFVRAPCPSKQVMYVRCTDLACGIQGIRSKSSPGASKSLGKISGPGDWPWHVALLKEDNHVCDATLVASAWLLTTASCFQGQPKAEWSARLGAVRLSSSSPWEQERWIVGMVKSPVEGSSLVLLKMDRPITAFSDFVRPVCLPSGGPASNDTHCNTLGWAKNRDLLQRVQLRYNAMEKCENVSIASVNSVCTEAVYPTDDCTEEEVAGSPLLCLEADGRRWSLAGVGNWRIACSKSGAERPRLYDQVASNLAWIKSTVG
ncbi:PREDICTED: atrial natriuretic peptide-converting enzyme [Ceratosolen solmsi marchali]|uniref:Atrial natriuretic peptide-converting enzyme n=1 Tax=Ceratosolen solmsi marchali TaxID=326594 RepID=A0AAJ6YVF0_9HYME|nr:PREDICTED: atrial natriuretic peptide-converting enzyme [Ceratosolen solmsi marchali]XP_011505071.1 PREDICTED: atrial natriuretic peptide-converting enzyme [Ceratosolen solmsi marchali]